jgi:PEP-CTERM/exosortase A-associated glycosyltransferase
MKAIIQFFDMTTPIISGYSMRSRYISKALHDLGYNLKAYRSSRYSYDHKQESIDNVEYHSVSKRFPAFIYKIPLIKDAIYVFDFLLETFPIITNDNTSLLDAHSSPLNGLTAVILAKKRHIPLIYEIRALWEDAAVDQGKIKENGLIYKMISKLELFIMNQANFVTVICEGLKQDIMARGIAEDKILVIENGVDSNKFTPTEKNSALIHKLGLENKIVLGFIGTMFEFEGLPLFIEAVNTIKNSVDNNKFHAVIVGTGRDFDRCQQLANAYHLNSVITFIGRVPHDEILDYYSIIDVFIYPRLSKRITEMVTPLKPLEAMSMAKLVIGSDVGGIKELIQHNYNGLLFKAGDTDALAALCISIIDNVDAFKTLATTARTYIEEKRDWLKICQKYTPFFEKLRIFPEKM